MGGCGIFYKMFYILQNWSFRLVKIAPKADLQQQKGLATGAKFAKKENWQAGRKKDLTSGAGKCIVLGMIVENEKIKVKELEKEFSFIKECL